MNSLHALLAFFFYENGYLEIPALGRFELSEQVARGSGQAEGRAFPEGSIRFTYNSRQAHDDKLIDYIMKRTRKMRALAISDLDSMADLVKEMLNLSQSYTFPGIGTLVPVFSGTYEVIPVPLISGPALVNPTAPPAVHQGELNPVIREGKVHSAGNHRTWGGVIIILVCLIIIGLLLYFYFSHGGKAPEMEVEVHKEMQVPAPRDSAKADTMPRNGLLHYEVIFEQAGYDRALYRYRQLTGWGHPVILHTTDSVHFFLAVKVTSAASDTGRIKDSVRALYGHPVSIQYLEFPQK